MKLKSIYIYPVKSLAGIEVSEAEVLERGLKGDRRMMLVDHMNDFITQRSLPEMAHFHVLSNEPGNYQITYKPDGTSVSFNVSEFSKNKEEVTVWGDVVRASPLNTRINKWLSERMGRGCRLVLMNDNDVRMTDAVYASTEVSFADGYPYLLTSQASLDDLNNRLDQPVGMERFRPNLVVDGVNAFEEDDFTAFKIGSAEFKKVKPCSRCSLTTVNPETAEVGVEPLKTLATFRSINNQVYFGINLICTKKGVVKVGDKLELL